MKICRKYIDFGNPVKDLDTLFRYTIWLVITQIDVLVLLLGKIKAKLD